MRQTVPLGRVVGIRVGMHWSVLVMVIMIGWLLGGQVLPETTPGQPAAAYWAVAVPCAIAFMAALLAHELAHSLVARRYGVPVTSITLWALGGISELGGEPPTARADLRIAADGPGIAIAALGWLAAMNVLLAAFNLLPGAPLDGGRILRAFLWRRTGDRVRAARSAATAGRAVGAALVILGTGQVLLRADAGGLWLALIGIFVMSAATTEAMAGAAAAALAGLRVSDVMTSEPDIGGTWMTVADFIDQIALRSAQAEFPVISSGGSLAGVTGVSKLARVPAASRASTTLGQVMDPVPPGGDPGQRLPADRPSFGGQR